MIVPQEEIKYIFNPYNLLPGDILLMNTYEEDMRARMKCKYEHAAIYIGDAFLMEANGAHVVMSHIYSYAFREYEHACVLRLKKSSPFILKEVARNARKQMGREYVNTMQFRYVRAYKNTDKQDESNKSFCSRLVAQSYLSEGIQLLPNADYCEPDDFLTSELLEVVPNTITEFHEDLAKVVMNQQQRREETEIESPNAELFHELSKLYGLNIQDLGQALLPSQSRPELNERAIEIIKSSKMFKHMEEVKATSSWLFDDAQFLSHYANAQEALHFLYSSMNHYDNTIIPYYKELHLQMIILAYYFSQNTLFVFMRDYIKEMVEEAITCRTRFADLFMLLAKERSTEALAFIEQYGLYRDIEYKPEPVDIGFLLKDIMKVNEKQIMNSSQVRR